MMPGRTLRYGLVAVVFFLGGLIAYLPASLITGMVADRTPLRFEGTTGTVFDGAVAYVSLPDGGIENLTWDLHPTRLLLGRLAADVQADTDLGTVSARVGRTLLGENRVDDLSGRASLGWLARLAGLTFMPVAGELDVTIDRLRFDDDMQIGALDGRADLRRARYELLNPTLALGRFQANLSLPAAERLQATLVDSQGPLALTGQATLNEASRYQLDVRLRARASADNRLERLLGQLGQPDAQGWYRLRENGQL